MARKGKNKRVFSGGRAQSDPFQNALANGRQFEATGQLAEAEKIYRQIVAQMPRHSGAKYRLACVLNQANKYELAVEHWAKLLQSDKNSIYILMGYGDCLFHLRRCEEAAKLYEHAIKFLNSSKTPLSDQQKSEAYYRLGVIYDKLDQYKLMEGVLLKAVGLNPDFADAHSVLGYMYSKLGQSEAAKASYRKAISANPRVGQWHRLLADEKHHAASDNEVEAMQSLYDSPKTDSHNKLQVAFGLGKAYEDMRQYKKAFSCWAEGNRLHREMNPYKVSSAFSTTEKLQRLYDSECVVDSNIDRSGQITPVFIVGMMRTGSSLVEQILASHSAIYGAGESEALPKVTSDVVKGRLSDPARLDLEGWRKLGRDYIAELSKGSEGQLFIVDKMLSNYKSLGLIRMMLPHAKIIHCRRDPMDVGLSAFKNVFEPGPLGYTCDLEDIGVVYRNYEELMEHWHKAFPGWIYDIDYESLVADLEQEVRKLLVFLDLPFEQACMAHYETKRAIKTASLAQVRKPVYSSSVKGWQNYKKELRPLKKALKRGFFSF